MTAQLELDPEGLVERIGDKTLVGHQIKSDLQRFREYVESRGGETGAWRGPVERPEP